MKNKKIKLIVDTDNKLKFAVNVLVKFLQINIMLINR